MKSMKKSLIIFLSLLVFIFSFTVNTYAETGYVDDCLENPKNCEEPLEPEPETNEAENELLEQEPKTGSLFFEIVKVVFALLLVLALIYIFLYFLKRRNKLGTRIKSLENIGGVSVGQNKSVQLLRLGDHLYLIGVGEDVTLLQKIEEKSLIEEIMRERDENKADFTTGPLLSSILQKKDENKREKPDNFKSLFNQELNSLKKNRKNIIDRHKEDNNE